MPANLQKNITPTTKFDELPKWKQRAILKEREKAASVQVTKAQRDAQAAALYEQYLAKANEKAGLRAYYDARKQGEYESSNKAVVPQGPTKSLAIPSNLNLDFNPTINRPKKEEGNFWEKPEFMSIIQGVTHGDFSDIAGLLTQKIKSSPLSPDGLSFKMNKIIGAKGAVGSPVEPTPKYNFINVPQEITRVGRDGKPYKTTVLVPQPYFIEERTAEQIRDDEIIQNQTDGKSWVSDIYPQVKYAFTKLFREGFGEKGIVVGGGTESEFIYQDDAGSFQLMAQAVLNEGIFAGEVIRTVVRNITSTLAVAGKLSPVNTPEENQRILDEYTQGKADDNQRIIEAWTLGEKSWQAVWPAMTKDLQGQLPEIGTDAPGTLWPAYSEPKAAVQARLEQDAALVESNQLFLEAEKSYKNGFEILDPIKKEELFNVAIQIQMQAIEARRKSDPMDAWGAATWSREPEKYQLMLRNAAIVELGQGRPLTVLEIRRLKETYANMWTEISAQMVFDLTNLVPFIGVGADYFKVAEGTADVTKILLKPIARASKLVDNWYKVLPETDILVKTVKGMSFLTDNLNVFSWLTSKSVRSAGDKAAQYVFGVFDRMGTAYGHLDFLLQDLPNLENMAYRISVMAPDDAMAFYDAEKLKGVIKGIQNIEFPEFKKLADLPNIGERTWSDVFRDSILKSTEREVDNLMKATPSITREVAEQIAKQTINKTREPLIAFAKAFEKAHIDAHLIYKGSPLTDDTFSGWMIKSLREVAGADINPKLIKNKNQIFKFDAWAEAMKLSESGKAKAMTSAKFIEATTDVFRWVRGAWTTLVLTTPRWVITNFIDSAGRDLVYGGNIWDDLFTLINSNQAHFAEEIGHLPMVLGSNLARGEVEYFESVPGLLLHGDVKPRFGLFSWWGYERKRLGLTTGDSIAEAVSKNFFGEQRNIWGSVWDGIKTIPAIPWKLGNELKAASVGISDFNTAIEFTLRTRMFHREYFAMLSKLEPLFKTQGMDGLNPIIKDLASRIWSESGGNASKIHQIVESLIGKDLGKGDQKFSLLLPSDWDEFLSKAGMADPGLSQAFTYDLKTQTDQFLESVVKTYGREATPQEIDSFTEIAKAKLQHAANATMSSRDTIRGVDTQINTAKRTVEDINIENLEGSHPPESRIREAESTILQPRAFTKKSTTTDAYKTVLGEVGKVNDIPGKTLISRMENGELVFDVGEDFEKLSLLVQKTAIYNAVNQSILLKNADVIKALNISELDFTRLLETFSKDPAQALKDSRLGFVKIANYISANPEVEKLLKASGQFSNFEGAYALHEDELARMWRAENSRLSPFNRPTFNEYKKNTESWSADRQAAGIERQDSFKQLMDEYQKVLPKDFNTVSVYRDTSQHISDAYKYFVRQVDPGYETVSGKAARKIAHHNGEHIIAESDRSIVKINNGLLELLRTNPKESIKVVEQWNVDFADNFLRRNGIELTWDSEKKTIMDLTIRREGSSARAYQKGSAMVDHIQSRFFGNMGIQSATPLREIAIDDDIAKQLTYGFREIAGLSSDQSRTVSQMLMNHARQWTKETGKPVEEYYARYGFQLIDGKFNIESDATEVATNAFVRFAKDKITLYGSGEKDLPMVLSQLSRTFYSDLLEMRGVDDASIKTINRFLSEVTGMRVTDGNLNDKQAEAFSRIFSEYILDGEVSHGSLKKPMDKMRTWLFDEYSVMKGTQLEQTLPPDVHKAMDLMFIQEHLKIQPNEFDIFRQLTKKFKNVTEEDILKVVNKTALARKAKLGELTQTEMLFALREIDPEAAKAAEAQLNQLNEAFSVYKLKRDIAHFPPEVTVNSIDFKQYLRERIDTEPLAIGRAYETMLYDLQNMENAVLTGSTIQPSIRPYMMSKGVQNHFASLADNIKNYDAGLKAIDYLGNFLKSGKHVSPTLTTESIEQLMKWRDIAVPAKSKLVSTLLEGGDVNGRTIEGAISKVNKRMLDYTDQNNLDVIMKNIFPFWMFPSRSLPFWASTLATHPQILAAYNKLQRLSRAQRFQSGAVTSQGRPAPSLEGYLQIPGTDLWFNPLAQFSFKYILNTIPDEYSTYSNQTSSQEDDTDPVTPVVRMLLDKSPILGFSMAPWTQWMLKGAFNISDSVLPAFPFAPEISLIPRWQVLDIIEKANKISFFGTPMGLGDLIYPEASFHDSLVEKKISQDAIQQMQEPGANKAAIVEAARLAIANKGDNALWQQTYKELTNKEAAFAAASFFTGLYPKEFTDATADMYALRNQINMAKSAMNNELQSVIFDLPLGAEDSWRRYLNMSTSSEGDIFRLYNSLNWIRNSDGQIVTDPIERATYLKLAIEDDINQEIYFNKAQDNRDQLTKALEGLEIGSSYESQQKAYDDYFKELDRLTKAYPFTYSRSWGSSKPAELLMNDLQDIFYKALNSSRPMWDDRVTQEENEARLKEWEMNLPKIGVRLHDVMLSNGEQSYHTVQNYNDTVEKSQVILDNLKPQQIIPPEFWETLKLAANKEALYKWQLSKDTTIDALNNAWKTMYWDEYWAAVSGKISTERDLIDADFAAQRPAPTAEELYQWISTEYGPNRFTLVEIRKLVNGAGVMDLEEAKFQRYGDISAKQQEVWDLLSWLGPHKDSGLMSLIQSKLQDSEHGIKGDALYDWYAYSGSQYKSDPQGLDFLLKNLKSVYAELGITAPRREYMVEYMEAQQTNLKFQEMINTKLISDGTFNKLIELGWVSANKQSEMYNDNPIDVLQDMERIYFTNEGQKDSINIPYQLEWRTDHPQEWTILQEYWAAGRAFAKTDANWATYYKFTPVPEQFKQAIEEMSGGYAQFKMTRKAGYKNGVYQRAKYEIVPQGFSQSDFGDGANGVELPPVPPAAMIAIPSQMQSIMGTMLVKDVSDLFSKGTPLEPAAVDFIKGLGGRHPEWSQQVQDILEQNQTP